MKTILILGASGMLGRYFLKYFKTQKYNVIGLTRKEFEADTITKQQLLDIIKENKCDIVVNCIGVIKPQIAKREFSYTLRVNTLFPHLLAEVVDTLDDVELFHITTDCIYSGSKTPPLAYDENDMHDVEDDYGLSKFMGEPVNCNLIRTSIIGEEVGQSRSLIEWVKSNKNGSINGYVNHFWNGVTCLRLAEIINEIIINNSYWRGKRHIHSNSVNKFELLNLINQSFNLDIVVNEFEAKEFCNRVLSTKYTNPNSMPLDIQLANLKSFSDILFSKENF